MIADQAAPKSVLAQKGAEFYLNAEKDILALFQDSAPDLRQALKEMSEYLRNSGFPTNRPPVVPDPTVDRRRRFQQAQRD